MPTTELEVAQPQMPDWAARIMEKVLIMGDLSKLGPQDRIAYYKAVCLSLGLNPMTKPFDYLDLDGKLVLYAKRDCADQLRNLHGVSVNIVSRELVDGIYVVTSQAKKPDGRTDESIGAVPLVKEGGEWKQAQSGKRFFQGNGTYNALSPEAKANAIMKAETKSKRRVTLSICGLSMMDESELDGVRGARPLNFDPSQGHDLVDEEPNDGAPRRALTPEEEIKEACKTFEAFDQALVTFKQQIRKVTGSEKRYYSALKDSGIVDASSIAAQDEAGRERVIRRLLQECEAIAQEIREQQEVGASA